MKRFRKPLAFILSLVMAFTLLPLHAFASGNVGATSYGDLYYTKYDDHIEIVGCKDTAVDVVVPATIDDLPVTVISGTKNAGNKVVSGAFAGLEYLQSVDMSQAPITTIENNTFSGSPQLYSVTFPSTLKTIGDEAFKDSFLLYQEDDPRSAITLPDSLETIGNKVFQGCSRLQFVTLSDNSSLTTIGNSAFSNCSSLESFNFPDGLTSMGFGAFSSCKALTSVDLSATHITTIENGTFNGCKNIAAISFPEGLVSIGEDAFSTASSEYGDYSNTALESLTFPDSLVTIGKNAFAYAISLENITWPQNSNLKTVNGFRGCVSLPNSIFENFPSSVTTIGEGAFTECSFTEVSIPSNIETIDTLAFADCASLSSLTISSGVKSIGLDAFANCYALAGQTVDVPETVNSVYGWAFSGCDSFTLIVRNRDLSLDPNDYPDIEGQPDEDLCVFDENGENPVWDLVPDGYEVNIIGYEKNSSNATSDLYRMYEYKHDTFEDITFTDLDTEPIPDPDPVMIPENHRIRVNITRDGTAFSSSDKLSFTLKNGTTTLVEGTDYTFSYPYFTLDESIEQDTVITLIVTPSDELKVTGGSATGTKAAAEFGEIELIPWGHVNLTLNGSFEGSNTVLVFDSEGKLVESGSAPDGYQTANLPAGTYTVVAFNKNDSFASVATLSQLDSMGLTQGVDYARGTVTVSDNAEATLTLSVPVLDTDSLSTLLADDGNTVLVETLKVGLGNTVSARVQYSLKNAPLSAVNVKVELPENSVLSGVYDSTQKVTASFSGNTVTIPVSEQAGTFYIYFTANKGGEQSVSAAITQGGVTAPLGTAMFTVETIFIDVGNRWTTTREGTAVINAGPQTPLTITMPDGSKRNLITNKAGSLRVNYTIPDTAASGDRFTIAASSDTASASATIVYMPSDTQIKEFYFVHAGAQTYLVKNGSNTTTKYYTYVSAGNESDKYWTFGATITSPTEIAEDSPVTVLIGMMDGSSMSFDLTRASASGSAGAYEYTYAGEIYLDQLGYHEFKSSLIPCEFDLLFGDQVKEIDTDAQFANAWNDAMDWQEELQNLCPDPDIYNPQLMGELLSGFYKVSDKDGFAELPDDAKDAVLEAETQLESAAKELCVALKIPYDSVNDFLISSEDPNTAPSLNVNKVLENNGIYVSENNEFDSEALTADGYTIYTVPAQRRGPQQHVAIKETENGFVTISEENGVKLEVDYAENAIDNTVTAARIDSLGTLGDVTELAAKKLSDNNLPAGNLGSLGKVAGAAAAGLQLYDANNNIKELGEDLNEIEKMRWYVENREMWRRWHINHGSSEKCIRSITEEIKAGRDLLEYLERNASMLNRDIWVGITLTVVGVASGGVLLVAVAAGSLAYDCASNMNAMSRASMIEIYVHNLNLAAARSARDCEGEIEEGIRRWKLKAILDPSGFVYEAMESNTLEGVTATMWYADNAEGTGAIQWAADEYDQVNPQVTAADGRFAWDVPTGFWQVRFTKAGYVPAATEWLEVPPPRMNLAIPMVTTEAPKVESANAYEDYIEVIFDQYMDKSAALTLPDGMTGEWQGDETYSKVLRITKDGGFTKGDEVALTIDGAKNYAGTPLSPSPYSKNLTVGARPAEIILNYESVVAMKAGETPNITVRIKDSDGNYMSGVTLSAKVGNTLLATIDASATTDDSGKAVFASSALLPGLTDITFTVDGTTLTKTFDLRITTDDNKPLRPTATIGDTEYNAASPKENFVTVDPGTLLTISAEDGVSIFYTTDDTCPCQNSASRNVYTGPIAVNADTRYRIAAYKDGMMYSDRLNINVTVNTPVEPDDPVDPVDPVVPDPDDPDAVVNPPASDNLINGIAAGSFYTKGDIVAFTAVGGGMANTNPSTGDLRWLPVNWWVNPSGDFAAGFTQRFSTENMTLGAHTLHVLFAQQRYDGANWTDTGVTDEKTVNFTLLAQNTPTVDPNTAPESSEEIANTADESMPVLWMLTMMFGLSGAYAAMAANRRKKEYIEE